MLESIFAAVGRDLHDEVPMVRLDPQYHLVFGAGGELKATPDLHRMEQAIAALSPADATQLRRFLADNRVKMDEFRGILESPFLRWRDLLSPQLLKVLAALAALAVARRRAAPLLRRPAHPPGDDVPVEIPGHVALQLPEPVLDPLVPRVRVRRLSSARRLRRGLAGDGQRRRGSGASISLDDEVEEILFEGRRAVGVRSRSGVHQADALVINADFARAMTRLVPDHLRRRWTDRKIASKKFSCSTFMLYLGIEGRYDDLAHHTIYLAKDYLENLADIEIAARALRRPVVLRPERLRHRPVAGTRRQEHALRPACR